MGMLRDAARSKIIRGALGVFALFLLAMGIFKIPVSSDTTQRTVQAKINATGLLQAIEGFYATYGSLPQPAPAGKELLTEGEEGAKLLTVLLGKEDLGDSMQNKRQIRFLTVEETRVKTKGGLFYSKGGSGQRPEGLYDSWGHPFHVIFDSGHNLEIPDPLKPGNVVRNKVAIVYSYGKDGKPGGEDDIKTW
ncbi:hypothetical protein [Haloferula sp. BvORR071]|uniref:hypothetical protein n=1 Tax=Haloferula sp. BvORR071 TaxID=1396141 RepID=UPI000550B75C|nr:hypothetical protein [Haloferula sp. BvORR071]